MKVPKKSAIGAFAHRAAHADEGSTLLEAIVAITIAALALGALYQVTTTSLRATERSKLHLTALALAQSQLGLLGASEPLAVGRTSGTYEGGITWQLTVTNLSRPDAPDPAPPYWIVLETFDRTGARLTHLETSRPGPPQS